MRHLRSLSILIAIAICLTPKTAIAHGNYSLHSTPQSKPSTLLSLHSSVVWNPLLELQNKIKHDKLVAYTKAKKKARLRAVQVAQRLAKQRAAIIAAQRSSRRITVAP